MRSLKPAAFRGFRYSRPSSVIISAHEAFRFERVLFDPTGGTFQIDAPASPVEGDRFAVKNASVSTTAITLSGNGANIEAVTGGWVFAATTVTAGTAGEFLEWEFDGTQWILI